MANYNIPKSKNVSTKANPNESVNFFDIRDSDYPIDKVGIKHIKELVKIKLKIDDFSNKRSLSLKILNRITWQYLMSFIVLMLVGFGVKLPWEITTKSFKLSDTILSAMLAIPIAGVITTLIRAIWGTKDTDN